MNEQAETQPATASGAEHERRPWLGGSIGTLALALLFGVAFGFLLQKGGVAKFDILIGVLLLEDFTVVKVMGSAIVIGLIGVFALRKAGLLELHIKDTVLGSNIIGGLIFGVGFGLLAYCPGTNAAALGQGNLDAIAGVVGLMAGSYVFAMMQGLTSGRLTSWGNLGRKRLTDLLPIPGAVVTAAAVLVMVAALVVIELVLR